MEDDEIQPEKTVLAPFDAFILSNELNDRILLLKILKQDQNLANHIFTIYQQTKQSNSEQNVQS